MSLSILILLQLFIAELLGIGNDSDINASSISQNGHELIEHLRWTGLLADQETLKEVLVILKQMSLKSTTSGGNFTMFTDATGKSITENDSTTTFTNISEEHSITTLYTVDAASTEVNRVKHRHRVVSGHRGSLFTLLNGTIEDIELMTRRRLIRFIHLLSSVQIPLRKKLLVWEVFKGGKPPKEFTKVDLEQVGDLLLDIPENDLFEINIADLEIQNYLGTLRGLNRRKAAILAYSALTKMKNILTNHTMINGMKGLLCGFSVNDLERITMDIIKQIDGEVFQNLWACDEKQITALLKSCMRLLRFRHVEVWNSSTVEHLGLLVTGLNSGEIKMIPPEGVKGIREYVIKRLKKKQLGALSAAQVANLDDKVAAAYNYRKYVENSSRRVQNGFITGIFIISVLIVKRCTF